MAVKAHYIQRRREQGFLPEIPARDLSDEDWAALSDTQRAQVEASGLYRLREDAPPKASKADK